MSDKKRLTSPKGVAVWPKVNEPDTKFDVKGIFSCGLRMSAASAAPMIATLTQMYDEYYASEVRDAKKKLKKCDLPWKECTNDSGNPTGEIEFKFKLTAKIDTKDGRTIEQRPILFDAKMRPMNDRVGGGSIVRIGFEPNLWNVPATGVGMTLRLKAVQVIELKEFGGRTAKDFGFSEEEGFETAFTEEQPEESGDVVDGKQF
jgi:hypothetical protein